MHKKWISMVCLFLLLAGAFFLIRDRNQVPRDPEPQLTEVPETTEEKLSPGDSMLYYGEIREISLDDQGNPRDLSMESPRDGAWIMHLGPDTGYVDSGEKTAFDRKTLQAGDRVYVFCSTAAAQTIPPRSAAFMVLKNIPMDASCAMYHEIEKLEKDGDLLFITTENGEKTLQIDENTEFSDYYGEAADASQLQEGNFLLAWYWDRGEDPLLPSHIMILP